MRNEKLLLIASALVSIFIIVASCYFIGKGVQIVIEAVTQHSTNWGIYEKCEVGFVVVIVILLSKYL